MLLVADPAIGAVLLAEAVFGEVRAGFEQQLLLGLDGREIIRVYVASPERSVLHIFVRAVAEHALDVVADEGGREITPGLEAVDHGRRRTEQQRQPPPAAA